jgi:hypothetical protein
MSSNTMTHSAMSFVRKCDLVVIKLHLLRYLRAKLLRHSRGLSDSGLEGGILASFSGAIVTG